MNWLEDLKRSVYTMSPLEERVTALGVCSKCHEKTLRPIVNGNGYRWQQCSKCLTCFADGSNDIGG